MSKKLLGGALALAMAASGAMAADKEKLVTIVTSGEPQTQLMSMVLTNQAMGQGHATRILLCGPGGDIALKAAPEGATAPQPPKGMSPQGLLQAAMKKGATVEVCAIYLPGKGADKSVLLDGVGVAAPPAMAEAMAAPNTVVWPF